jgi:hypothetical protein
VSDRDVVFISHATPDDNEFVRWLGTRLTGYGYKVWADIFDLAGGTPFWVSIEDAIRKKAVKVVLVVSRASCDPGRSRVRNEISVADAVKKSLTDDEFIIPVRIDDVPFADLPIQIHQLNAIDFSKGWGNSSRMRMPLYLDVLDTDAEPEEPDEGDIEDEDDDGADG